MASVLKATGQPGRGGRYWRWLVALLIAFLLLFAIPTGVAYLKFAFFKAGNVPWHQARRDSAGISPPAAEYPDAIVQLFAARAFGWRSAFAVHSWFAVKEAGAQDYRRIEVIGWGSGGGRPVVRIRAGMADNFWFGNPPQLLLDLRGRQAELVIEKIRQAVERYPHAYDYTVWPGPNSNSFTAFVLRSVPELAVELPATAVGKDYLPRGAFFAPAPSNSGYQLSIGGVFGGLLAWEEGLELHLLGTTAGIDFSPPALKLPGLGRLGWQESPNPGSTSTK